MIEEFQQQCPDVIVHVSVGSTAEVRHWLKFGSGHVRCHLR